MTITDEKLREAVEYTKRPMMGENFYAGKIELAYETLEAALTELMELRAAAKNIDYHADILRYTMTQKFSRQELDFARDNLLTACNELPTPPKEASHD